jgi:adenosylhomocysteine nucleosidase
MNRENHGLCIVFPMGMEAYPFLKRVEVTHRSRAGKAVYREAFFEGKSISIVRSGMGPVKASEAIKNLPNKPSAILCAGSAGGLVSDLMLGQMVISSETVSGTAPERAVTCSEQLVTRLADACRKQGTAYRVARLATVTRPVFRRTERQRLHDLTGAHAVDMESHAVGVEARRLGISFVSLRVISDDVDKTPPDDRRGFKKLLSKPREIPGRLVAGMHWWKFLKDFRHAVNLLHPVLVQLLRDADKPIAPNL